jgi:hypothetical protein
VFPKREALIQPFAVLRQSWRACLARHRLLRAED